MLQSFEFNPDLIEEECRLNLVKAMVDSACAVIATGIIRPQDREHFRSWVKNMVLPLIPGEEEKYDMIYDSRLKRHFELSDFKFNDL
jgi:hypothetical protein